ncbi:anti-Muellerian hormone type-2 receptor-like isoform X2 [Mugil cephalus]|uniref:anti-Muellerian hormone type-2 receptor-like isoform X2 n=1 Tax=Mugil cephalus TaxID=48193 RepID=UPI001FB58DE3|nr:anti-Muellerian hormone type-2 receptor-like isoform X2 [Mugil cephalus]
MILQQWLVLALECTLICISSHASPQKRQCAFQVTSQTSAYSAAGNVSGSVQLCKNTQCCVGFYHMSEGQLKVDVLACDVVEKSCPDATCKGQPRVNNNYIMCVCNTDLCNSNITWTTESEHPPRIYSAKLKKTAVNVLVVTLLLICFGIIALKWKKASLQSSHPDFSAPAPCSCHTTRTSEIDIDHIELQQVVGQGHFATVFQGKYKGSMVAVKVLPAGWKYKFAAEKEIYELPLMKHGGIVHFLGSGRKPDDSSWFIVLQLAEYGSLHSFLCKQTSSWMVSLKLCQSLSQGLSHLHSELGSNDVHKPPVAHGDLSSFNVLVRADGSCALCDFGCSTILCSCSRCRCWRGHVTNMEGHTQMGTLNYMSPEILEGSVNLSSRYFLMQGDVYALGLLLWEIWMRCSDLFESSVVPQHLLPYELELGTSVTLDSLILFVSHMDKRPSIPEHWELLPQGSALKEILTECWDCEPDARLTAQRVVDRLVCLQSSYSL